MGVALVAGSVILSAMLWLLAEPVMRMLASGFDPQMQARSATLLRVGTGAIVFAVIEAVLRSRLIAAKKFALSGLSYIWQAVGIITAAVWWQEAGALGMMWGLIAGTAGSAAWNLAILFVSRGTMLPGSDAIVAGVPIGRVWVWGIIVLLTDSIAQLYAVVDRWLGTYLDPGAIASLNYANLTAGLPSAMIGLALATAILPFLSDASSANDTERSHSIMDRAIQWTVLLAVPVSIWLIAFRVEIAAMLFHRGAFDARALSSTSSALSAAAVGILPVSIAAVLSRLLYASRAWVPITVTAIVALFVKAVLSIGFVSPFGATGLALATSCAYLVAACLTGFLQRVRITPHLHEWMSLAAKTLLLVGIPTMIGIVATVAFVPDDLGFRSALAILTMLAGLAVLILGGRRWGIAQMDPLLSFLWPRYKNAR
jgi:putative peptidoglycan lipid II flippase